MCKVVIVERSAFNFELIQEVFSFLDVPEIVAENSPPALFASVDSDSVGFIRHCGTPFSGECTLQYLSILTEIFPLAP